MGMRSVSTMSLSGALALFLVASGERPLQLVPVPEFLDPGYLALAACGKRPDGQNIFLRKEFRLALLSAASAAPATTAPAIEDRDPPLDSGYGAAHFPISSPSSHAQAYFDQGLKLVYGFNHWEAGRAFRAAARRDPNCAICYWGQALVLGPHINAPMDPASLDETLAALARAQSLSATASPVEKALIDALQTRYAADPAKTRMALDEAYAAAMTKVYAAFPDNPHIAILYAEAVMDTSPWDYWEKDGKTPKVALLPAIRTVEQVMKAHPDHAGANHLYIHLMEASLDPGKAEAAADRLATEAPLAGHLVHMPGHIYFRVGRYQDALNANRQAVLVDERYLAGGGGSDVYRYGYYPHNVHFLLASAEMAGDGVTAMKAAEKLDHIIPAPMLDAVPWLSHPVKASVYFAAAQFAPPDAVLAIEAPPAKHPYLLAMWHYARGRALAESGQAAAAMAEADAISGLIRTADLGILVDNNVPAPDIMTLAELVLRGKALAAAGNFDAALATLQKAAEKQRAIPYMEPPYWHYSVEQSVGGVLLRMNQPLEAIDAFNRSLMMHPNNAWSLYGLMLARQKIRDPAAAATETLYRKAVMPSDAPPPRLEQL